MKGSLDVASNEGKGSVFRLILELPAAAQISALQPIIELGTGAKVLVAGDITGSHQLTMEWCKRWNMEVVTAKNADNAVMLAYSAQQEGSPFDIIIVDEVLELLNCIKLAKKIRADALFDRVSLLLITVSSLGDKGRVIEEAGFNGYLARPVKEHHLHKSMLQLLKRHRQQRSHTRVRGLDFITPHTFSRHTNPKINAAEGQVRVLLAEDNIINQKVAVRMLKNLGCIVDIAVNGSEAVRMWRQSAHDIIFMDCHMPILDGYQATEEIRKSEMGGRRIPIVALTANAMEGEAQVCAKVGMDAFIAKPVKVSDLEAVLLNYTQGYHRQA